MFSILRPLNLKKRSSAGILLPLLFSFFPLFAQTTPPQDPPEHSPQAQTIDTNKAVFVSSQNWWVNASVGYDYSFFSDLNTSAKNYSNFLQFNVPPPNISSSTKAGNGGVRTGLELGFKMDGENGFSLNLENVLSQGIGWTQLNSGTVVGSFNITPDLMSATLSYDRVLFKQNWGEAHFSLGGGLFHAAVAASYYDSNVGQTNTGTFTGDILGGTLGVGQVINLGNSFEIECSVKVRLATFSELTATTLTPNNNFYPGPYRLVVIQNENLKGAQGQSLGLTSNTDYLLYTPQQLMDLHPEAYRLAVVDYSGISGDISLRYYF